MNTLKQQIVDTRNYLYQNRMYSELEGFDTAIRMFADANKKSFKDRAAEVWKKHKGKILAGAALAAAGVGAYGYKKYQDSKIPEKVVQKTMEMTHKALVANIVEAMEGKEAPWWKGIPSRLMLSYYKKNYPGAYEEAEAIFKQNYMSKMIAKGSDGKPVPILPGPKAS